MSTQLCDSNIISFDEFTKKVNPVFIIGAPRSGTTLTFNVMEFHPQVLKLPHNTYFIPHYWKFRNKIPIRAQSMLLRWVLDFAPERSKSELLPVEYEKLDNLRRTLSKYIEEGDPKKIFGFMSYISYIQKAANNNINVTWWAERTHNHIFHYKMLKEWFPSCKFILCVRDPRAKTISALGAARKSGRVPSPHYFCVDSAIEWTTINRVGNEIKKKYRNDIFISKYEGFVEAPEEHLNCIWKFLGLPEMSQSDLRDEINGLGNIYTSKTGVKRDTGIDSKSVYRWKELLSPTEKSIIEDITNKTAKLFNYEFEDKKVSAGFYIKKLPKDNLRVYIIYLVKLFLFKVLPSRLLNIYLMRRK